MSVMSNEGYRLPVMSAAPEQSLFSQSSHEADHSGEKLTISVGRAEWERPGHGEDTILQNDEKRIWGVFDGLGQSDDPKLASQMAADAINEKLSNAPQPKSLRDAINNMREAFTYARHKVTAEGKGGQTTAVVAQVVSFDVAWLDRPQERVNYLVIGNAGDSRSFSMGDHGVTSISTDQSKGNVVYNAFGSDHFDKAQKDDSRIHAPWLEKDEFIYSPLPDNADEKLRVMLCSDGITGDWEDQFLSDDEMTDASFQSTVQESADKFLELSKKNDDKSVLVIGFNENNHGASAPAPSQSAVSSQPTRYKLPQTPQKKTSKELVLAKNYNPRSDAYRENISLADAEEEAWAMKDYIDLTARRERTVAGGFRRRSKGQRYMTEYVKVGQGEDLPSGAKRVDEKGYAVDGKGNRLKRSMRDANGKLIRAHVTKGRASQKNVEKARQNFETIRNQNKRTSAESMAVAGYNRDEYMVSSIADDTSETTFIAKDIANNRKELASTRYERVQKFYDWWARQGGKKLLTKGNAKKAAVVAAPSFVAGMALRSFLPGVGVGVGAAVGVARAYGAGLAVGRIEQGSDTTVADKQAQARREIQLRLNKKAYRERKNTASITEAYAYATRKEVLRNRKRLGKAAVIGGVAGALGVPLGRLAEAGVDHAIGLFNSDTIHGVANYNGPKLTHNSGSSLSHGGGHQPYAHSTGGNQPPSSLSHGGGHVPQAQTGATHELSPNGKSFHVEHGSGEIREIQQYAASRGHNISAERATDIWNHAHAKFGDKVIKLSGKGPSTYSFTDSSGHTNVGLARAGIGHWWSRSVEQYVDDQISR